MVMLITNPGAVISRQKPQANGSELWHVASNMKNHFAWSQHVKFHYSRLRKAMFIMLKDAGPESPFVGSPSDLAILDCMVGLSLKEEPLL